MRVLIGALALLLAACGVTPQTQSSSTNTTSAASMPSRGAVVNIDGQAFTLQGDLLGGDARSSKNAPLVYQSGLEPSWVDEFRQLERDSAVSGTGRDDLEILAVGVSDQPISAHSLASTHVRSRLAEHVSLTIESGRATVGQDSDPQVELRQLNLLARAFLDVPSERSVYTEIRQPQGQRPLVWVYLRVRVARAAIENVVSEIVN